MARKTINLAYRPRSVDRELGLRKNAAPMAERRRRQPLTLRMWAALHKR